MNISYKNLIYGILTLCLCACKPKPHAAGKNYTAAQLKTDDSEFLALKDTAQHHLSMFVDSLAQHGEDIQNYRFAAKSDYVEHGKHEHMWSQITGYKNGRFFGVFVDSAFVLKNIKKGDQVSIAAKDIEDWSIYNYQTRHATGDFSDAYLKSKAVK